MNLGEVIRVLARRWLLIVGCTLIGLLISGLLLYKVGSGGITPRKVGYKSSATILLDQPKVAGTAATAAMGRLLVLPTTYVEIIQSDEIAQRASEKLNGVYSAEDIRDCTSGESTIGTQVMTISSCGDNPTDAQAVTNAVVDSLKDWLNQRQDGAGVLGANRLAISVLSAPQVPKSPSGFPPMIWVMVGGVLGFMVGILMRSAWRACRRPRRRRHPRSRRCRPTVALLPSVQEVPHPSLPPPPLRAHGCGARAVVPARTDLTATASRTGCDEDHSADDRHAADRDRRCGCP